MIERPESSSNSSSRVGDLKSHPLTTCGQYFRLNHVQMTAERRKRRVPCSRWLSLATSNSKRSNMEQKRAQRTASSLLSSKRDRQQQQVNTNHKKHKDEYSYSCCRKQLTRASGRLHNYRCEHHNHSQNQDQDLSCGQLAAVSCAPLEKSAASDDARHSRDNLRVKSKMLRLIRWPLVHLCLPLCLMSALAILLLVSLALPISCASAACTGYVSPGRALSAINGSGGGRAAPIAPIANVQLARTEIGAEHERKNGESSQKEGAENLAEEEEGQEGGHSLRLMNEFDASSSSWPANSGASRAGGSGRPLTPPMRHDDGDMNQNDDHNQRATTSKQGGDNDAHDDDDDDDDDGVAQVAQAAATTSANTNASANKSRRTGRRHARSLLMPINELRVSGSKLEPPSRPSQDWSKQRPYFGSNIQRNISVELGKTAHLICKVFELGDKTVSWLRPRENEILTAGKYTYIGDSRISSMNEHGSTDWILEIKDASLNDSASYECQVSTDPKMSMIINLHVQAARAKIKPGENNYYPVGSSIEFSCEVLPPSGSTSASSSSGYQYYQTRSSSSSLYSINAAGDSSHSSFTTISPNAGSLQDAATASQQIYWYHNGNLINYAKVASNEQLSSRHHKFSIDWDAPSQTSRLKLTNIQLSDAGNYTCKPTSAEPATVRLFVKKRGSASSRVPYSGSYNHDTMAAHNGKETLAQRARQHYGLDNGGGGLTELSEAASSSATSSRCTNLSYLTASLSIIIMTMTIVILPRLVCPTLSIGKLNLL